MKRGAPIDLILQLPPTCWAKLLGIISGGRSTSSGTEGEAPIWDLSNTILSTLLGSQNVNKKTQWKQQTNLEHPWNGLHSVYIYHNSSRYIQFQQHFCWDLAKSCVYEHIRSWSLARSGMLGTGLHAWLVRDCFLFEETMSNVHALWLCTTEGNYRQHGILRTQQINKRGASRKTRTCAPGVHTLRLRQDTQMKLGKS